MVCSILTWLTGKNVDEGKPEDPNDWLSMFGQQEAAQEDQGKRLGNLHKKRVYSSLNSKDIMEIRQNLKRSIEMF